MNPEVRVYTLKDKHGEEWRVWLCGRHKDMRLSDGWTMAGDKDPPHGELKCDDRWVDACGEAL